MRRFPFPIFPILAALLGLGAAIPAPAAPADAPNLLDAAVSDGFRMAYDPWRGTDNAGLLRGLVGTSPAVNAAGQIQTTGFAAGVEAADFGRGVLDLLTVDSQGHFWYYPNSGTKQAPKFTTGTPLPAFLSGSPSMIQMVGADLMLGSGDGQLFLVRGSSASSGLPRFDIPQRIESVELKTRRDGKLWCNFLSPAYGHWRGETSKDLLIGDGTYAADNVYFLRNKGSDDRPQFEDPVIAVPGNGREQLVVRAWPGKGGRSDLLAGDREGKLLLYANETGPSDEVPRFKSPQPLRLGASESFGALARFAVADLNGDGVPDLVLALPDGTFKVAYNTGTAEQPRFEKAEALKGEAAAPLPVPTRWTFSPPSWTHGIPPGSFFYQLRVVGGQAAEAATYEEGFTPPEGGAAASPKHAVKFSFVDAPSGGDSYPVARDEKGEEMPYQLFYSSNGTGTSSIPLQEKTNYELRFQVKGSGFSKFTVRLFGAMRIVEKKGGEESYSQKAVSFIKDIDLSSSWSEVRVPIAYQIDKDSDVKQVGFYVTFNSTGKGTYYLSDMSLRQK